MADEGENNELDGLRDKVDDLESQLRSVQELLRLATIRLGTAERNVDEAKNTAQEALEAAQDAGSVTGGGDGVGGGGDDEDDFETPPPLDASVVEPYAYKVIEAGGQVFCYIPKKPDQEDGGNSGAKELYGGAYGGPHFGSKESPKADKDSPPYAAAGFSGISGDFSWAHYGWHPVGSLTPESGKAAEKIVVASFKVPLDPPEDQRGDGTKIEGPSLSDISLTSPASWKSDCENSWEQFDPAAGSGAYATRKIPIALVANGLVTQLCMGVPFVDRGAGGSGDPTVVDSRYPYICQKSVDFYSHDEPVVEDPGTPDREIKNLDGTTTVIPGTPPTYRKTTKTTDGNGNEVETVGTTTDAGEADKETVVTDIIQLYDFTDPTIHVTEMPVPTPVVTNGLGEEKPSSPVFIIRSGGTGEACPSVMYTQLKFVDNRCPQPEVWLESAQGGGATLYVRSWTQDGSGNCVSGVTQYHFNPTSVDAPDCCGIRACINEEVTALTGVQLTSSGLVFHRKRFNVVGVVDETDITIAGSNCEDGGGS